MNDQYWILLADVVGSRHIRNRAAFEPLFERVVQKVNESLASSLLLPIRTWKGLDELAAVIAQPSCLYRLADSLNSLLAPERIRMVVVKDRLDVVPESKDVRAADGPGFHRAAGLMPELKKDGLLFSVQTADAALDQQLKVGINTLLLLKENWTERQRLMYTIYREHKSQEEVARQLSVTQQTVSKTLKAIRAAQVQLLEDSLQQWLDQQFEQPCVPEAILPSPQRL